MMRKKVSAFSLMLVGAIAVAGGVAWAQDEPALVSIGHGIPGADIGPSVDPLLPVDIIVDNECFYDDLKFGQFVGPIELPEDTYSVAVALSDGEAMSCDGDVVIGPVDIPFESGDVATIFAHLTDAGAATATVFEDSVDNVIAGKTRLAVRHTAAAGPVDVVLQRGWMRGRVIAEIEDLMNPEEAGPVDLRPGAYAVSIFDAVTGDLALRVQPFVTNPGVLQNVYAVGTPGGTFTLLVQTFDLGFTPPRSGAAVRGRP
jgi:hypothetical protein